MKRKVSDQIVEALQQAVERGVKQWLNENKQELLATTKQALIEAHRPVEPSEPQVEESVYLTPSQLAARWGFHVGSVLRRLRAESWPTVRVGRRASHLDAMDRRTYLGVSLILCFRDLETGAHKSRTTRCLQHCFQSCHTLTIGYEPVPLRLDSVGVLVCCVCPKLVSALVQWDDACSDLGLHCPSDPDSCRVFVCR